jgi:hypothetical protein
MHTHEFSCAWNSWVIRCVTIKLSEIAKLFFTAAAPLYNFTNNYEDLKLSTILPTLDIFHSYCPTNIIEVVPYCSFVV